MDILISCDVGAVMEMLFVCQQEERSWNWLTEVLTPFWEPISCLVSVVVHCIRATSFHCTWLSGNCLGLPDLFLKIVTKTNQNSHPLRSEWHQQRFRWRWWSQRRSRGLQSSPAHRKQTKTIKKQSCAAMFGLGNGYLTAVKFTFALKAMSLRIISTVNRTVKIRFSMSESLVTWSDWLQCWWWENYAKLCY